MKKIRAIITIKSAIKTIREELRDNPKEFIKGCAELIMIYMGVSGLLWVFAKLLGVK